MADKNNKFGKPDQDRLGMFSEMGYISVGDPFKERRVEFNAGASKGKQFSTKKTISKKANALEGYFDNKPSRLFEGEAVTDTYKLQKKEEKKQKAKNLGGTFKPSSTSKAGSGLGSHFGTFGGKMEYFNPKTKPAKKAPKEGRNFLTNPPKKGTFGVPGTTLGQTAFLLGDKYEAKDELAKKERVRNKSKMRGPAFKSANPKKGGNFDPDAKVFKLPTKLPPAKKSPAPKKIPVPFYPSKPAKRGEGFHKITYKPPGHRKQVTKKPKGPVWKPNPQTRTHVPCKSILSMQVGRTINSRNYRTATF